MEKLTMDINQQRAEFEAWADNALACTFITNAQGEYMDRLVAEQWLLWQARACRKDDQPMMQPTHH